MVYAIRDAGEVANDTTLRSLRGFTIASRATKVTDDASFDA